MSQPATSNPGDPQQGYFQQIILEEADPQPAEPQHADLQPAYPPPAYTQQAYPQPDYPQKADPQPASHQQQQQQEAPPPQQPQQEMTTEVSPDSGWLFSDKSIRRAFIRKVYSILAVQLILTGAIIGLFYIDSFRQWNTDNPGLLIASAVATIVLMIALICAPDMRRKSPINLIVLMLFTACEGMLLGSVCATVDTDAVLKAVLVTAIIFFGLTAFAFQTKIDFTMMAGALCSLVMCLILFGFMCLIFQSNTMDNLYAASGAFLFSCFIVVDTQLLMGGKRKLAISPEEYIFAALNLYLDIINIFIYMLMLFRD
ncbi:protein lifeguard 1-like [Hyalella azteca]|uniref:Protein lifeguard 1-like n=1 Tax=Hyalella azteca TaxID=294128 RepID=A0A979FNY5_HYAAZ|nr:protein lifeguard 1-like [Hyalella azteca]